MPIPKPLPTPYDITPIPLFPIIPGTLAWLVVAALAVLVALLIARIPLSRRGSPASAVSTAEKELRLLRSRDLDAKELLTGVSLVARRLLTALTSHNVRSCTAAEIRAGAAEQPEPLRPLLLAAAEIEELRFLPALSRAQANVRVETLTEALLRARTFFETAGEKR